MKRLVVVPGLWLGVCVLIAGAVPGVAQQKPAPQRKSLPAQASVARGAALAAVPASSPAVSRALDARKLDAARKMVGKATAFTGTVTKVFSSKGNSVTMLNFAPNYRAAIVAVVRPAAYARFPNLQTLTGKRVWLSGKVVLYKGRPEIELLSPSQIKLVR